MIVDTGKQARSMLEGLRAAGVKGIAIGVDGRMRFDVGQELPPGCEVFSLDDPRALETLEATVTLVESLGVASQPPPAPPASS